ncbi:45488_t:CDS:2 [Gigaspora margarita]|uniref:45488_t:CDS:1 n=1 Tax=Gigaspora margarita TaxID=4874 RepID=A0ABN7UWC6_GIGMA|nr:45488_t:CDS:2 [Gigaspora margarita]
MIKNEQDLSLSSANNSETETVLSISTTPSASSANNSNDPFVAYCKVCKADLVGTCKNPYPYSQRSGNTSNFINYLRNKHGITKENHLEFLDEHNEVYTN